MRRVIRLQSEQIAMSPRIAHHAQRHDAAGRGYELVKAENLFFRHARNYMAPAGMRKQNSSGKGLATVISTELIPFLLPHLYAAGRYSAHIQRSINARPAKRGETAFQQALSDADLSVQAFLEVALLSRFPDVAFFSEEYADSFNAKYFPAQAAVEVLVDPIDGTRAYLDGADSYQIIVSIREYGKMTAALCHMPRRELCYAGVRGKKSTVGSIAEMQQGSVGDQPIRLSAATRRVIIFNAPEVKQALARNFEVIDIYEEYVHKRLHHGFTELLSGQAAACIHPRPQVIDAGAIAFIAEQAGATLTGFRGEPLEFDHPPDVRGPGLVVSASQHIHDELLQALGQSPLLKA